MINFRFHVASLIAVFLALAIGVVIGSTVIDRAIVDGLRNQIDRVERKADNQKSQNDELRDEISRLQGYVEGTASFVVTDRLRDLPVAVLAVDGVDGDTVKKTVELMQQAGGAVPGILWIEGSWALAEDDDAQKLARALDQPKDKTLRGRAWRAVAERLAAGSGASAKAGDGAATDVLTSLSDAGFLRYEPVGTQPDGFSLASYPGKGTRALFVDGNAGRVPVKDVVLPAAQALTGAGIPTVAAELDDESGTRPDRGSVVAPVRDDGALQDVVSTVDDLDFREGRVTAVLAVSDLGSNVVGHYGYGAGANRSLPEWSQR